MKKRILKKKFNQLKQLHKNQEEDYHNTLSKMLEEKSALQKENIKHQETIKELLKQKDEYQTERIKLKEDIRKARNDHAKLNNRYFELERSTTIPASSARTLFEKIKSFIK